ncbi:glycosyltransferase [Domibacillus sp.]|uniref:glycosyltransferase family 2 protein n=1 Tax=Domibacillus sp. TaxID=1969783 RepID=UPI0028128321|nr:glycosyltransferase [Domibacillus sp.]
MSYKVSVIIPVYNAEKYIAQCIESLANQTLKECEFIFINDGSWDNSKQIIESFQKKDKRIKLINRANQGVSAARNSGLKAASGEYVGFVDADDYIGEDMYERLYTACMKGNYDAVISNVGDGNARQQMITKYPFPVNHCLEQDYIQKHILPYFLKSDNLNTVCTKLYKMKIIKQNNLFFPEGIALGEDGLFNLYFMSSAHKIIYLDYTGYHYRAVNGSATRNISEKDYFKRALEVYELDLPVKLVGAVDQEKIKELKSIRLINSVMSYIHVYFMPSKMRFNKRYQYVRGMITNKSTREALPYYVKENYSALGRYQKFLINMIRKQSVVGLYCATAYSRFRNK